MGYLAPGDIFKNMLQLKRFGLYYEIILNGYYHIEIMISAIEMLEGSDVYSPRKF